MRFTSEALAAAVRGTVDGPAVEVSGAAIDSRAIAGGELFVPLVGARDGHDFVAAAVSAGAPAYLTHRDERPDGATAIRVEDTSAAFTRLGAVARDRLPDAVIGITGSVGKTSVKDLLASAVATTFRTASSARNHNNELGVPLTLVNAPDDTEVLVQEMGARSPGDIAHLCRIARPCGAIVTMVAAAHTSEFRDLDEIAQTKGELVEAVPVDGFVVLNQSDARVRAMASRTDARVLTFGVSGDVVAQRVGLDDELRPRFRLGSPWGSVDVQLRVHGVHQVANALAASAAALAQGVPLEAVAAGLASAELSSWRMEFRRTRSGAVVINDAYNANPTSMAAALQSLAAVEAERRVAVLGLMAELGPDSDELHAEMGELALDLGLDVIAVDCPQYEAGEDVPDVAAAVAALGELGPDVAVLVKASRAAQLERVADALT